MQQQNFNHFRCFEGHEKTSVFAGNFFNLKVQKKFNLQAIFTDNKLGAQNKFVCRVFIEREVNLNAGVNMFRIT